MSEFTLPDLGEGLNSAQIVSWRVGVGDAVHVDQVVVEVETGKATVEVPIPFAGVVTGLHAAAGQSIAVGSPLISVGSDIGTGFREPGVSVPERSAASGNVLVGYGTAGSATSAKPGRRRHRRHRPAPPSAAASVASSDSASGDTGSRPIPVISPLVRKMARDARLDLASVRGSGPAGLVRRTDVEKAMTAAGRVSGQRSAIEGVRRIPIEGLRKVMAEKLSRSRREIPEATVWVDVDATALLDARAALNAARPDQSVSLLALVSRFAVLGLRAFPELNARIEVDQLVIPTAVHLGFAAQTERGLVVPVVHDAHRLSTRQLSEAIAARTVAARSGDLGPSDLSGGTFTVNNYGVFGVDGSAAIINHPEVAILGIGRVIDKPWVVDGELAVRKVCQLTLAFDHRACDGSVAGGFLRYVADCVQQPVAALGDL